MNDNFTKHVGFQNSTGSNEFFSDTTVQIIYNKVLDLLQGLHPSGRPIAVSKPVIQGVMNNIYSGFTHATGDIYTRYNIPNGLPQTDDVKSMIDQCIEVIVSTVRT